ncbi:ricin-type beta-trefoil lectin domain protein, partial [Streptomyces sp. 1222.5]|uniref:ricin-type beta-trefoil lectin domain protein n=1 Tax=Streptomyces sp. 1222.5 TaxID=1881026 RepID=UPI003EB98462
MTQLSVVAVGAQGSNGTSTPSTQGGSGAHVTATLPVSQGQDLVMQAGCQAHGKKDAYGYGQGGSGGVAHGGGGNDGMAGGGASGITTGAPALMPLVVAGGGGGAGGDGYADPGGDLGGAGGSAGKEPQPGSDGAGAAHGAGGDAAAAKGPDGGKGGGSSSLDDGGGGGGGGGGYKGGLGGGGATGGGNHGTGGGGGGAGSSFVTDTATSSAITTSGRSGDGLVTISWEMPAPPLGPEMIRQGDWCLASSASSSDDSVHLAACQAKSVQQRWTVRQNGRWAQMMQFKDGFEQCVAAKDDQTSFNGSVGLVACNSGDALQGWQRFQRPTTGEPGFLNRANGHNVLATLERPADGAPVGITYSPLSGAAVWTVEQATP